MSEEAQQSLRTPKLLAGCIVAVLGLAVVSVVGVSLMIYFVARDAKETVDQLEVTLSAEEDVAKLEKDFPFWPPEAPEVQPDQVRRFKRITHDTWREIKTYAAEINLATAEEEWKNQAWQDGRRALIDALEIHQTSLGEYLWIANTLLEARDLHAQGIPHPSAAIAEGEADFLVQLLPSGETNMGRVLLLGGSFMIAEEMKGVGESRVGAGASGVKPLSQ